MVWVLVVGGIALGGLVMLVCYAVWLLHKTADVLSEVGVLFDRSAELVELLGQIGAPDPARPAVVPAGDGAVEGRLARGWPT